MEPLTEFGFTENESKIYLKLLENEELTANKIAQQTNINRSVVYSHLDSLIEKGLVSYAIKNNVKYFRAAKPETLLHYLKEKEKTLRQLLPKLNAIKKESSEEITVEVYKGTEGAITIIKDMLRTKSDIYILGYAGQPEEIIPIYIKQYIRQLNENKIKERILAIKGSKILAGNLSEIRYLPKEFSIPTSTVIYSDKIVIVVYTKPYFSILIKSREVAESYLSFFKLLWRVCEK